MSADDYGPCYCRTCVEKRKARREQTQAGYITLNPTEPMSEGPWVKVVDGVMSPIDEPAGIPVGTLWQPTFPQPDEHKAYPALRAILGMGDIKFKPPEGKMFRPVPPVAPTAWASMELEDPIAIAQATNCPGPDCPCQGCLRARTLASIWASHAAAYGCTDTPEQLQARLGISAPEAAELLTKMKAAFPGLAKVLPEPDED